MTYWQLRKKETLKVQINLHKSASRIKMSDQGFHLFATVVVMIAILLTGFIPLLFIFGVFFMIRSFVAGFKAGIKTDLIMKFEKMTGDSLNGFQTNQQIKAMIEGVENGTYYVNHEKLAYLNSLTNIDKRFKSYEYYGEPCLYHNRYLHPDQLKEIRKTYSWL